MLYPEYSHLSFFPLSFKGNISSRLIVVVPKFDVVQQNEDMNLEDIKHLVWDGVQKAVPPFEAIKVEKENVVPVCGKWAFEAVKLRSLCQKLSGDDEQLCKLRARAEKSVRNALESIADVPGGQDEDISGRVKQMNEEQLTGELVLRSGIKMLENR